MTDQVINEVVAERRRQDEKWGGPEHDDQHLTDDFFSLIDARITYNMKISDSRKALIEIAALAVAAVESLDRRWP